MKTFLLLYSMFFLALFVILFCGYTASAQHNPEIDYASNYLESRTSSLDKYLNRSRTIQQRLLRRLKKQEAFLRKQLAAKDSVLYRKYLDMPLTYDSITALSRDTTLLNARANKHHTTIDSLKSIKNFIQKKSSRLNAVADAAGQQLPGAGYTSKFTELQSELNAEQQVKDLILQRSESLEQLAGSKNIKGLQYIQKKIYYAHEKLKAWRALADDPDKAEEQAMEYLQGVEGFDSYLNTDKGAFGGLGASATAADLQTMGYQTKGTNEQNASGEIWR